MDTSKLNTELSVVLPAWNEGAIIQESLRLILAYADTQKWDIEVVVVDDASSDETFKSASGVDATRVHVVRHERNRGKGAAVRTGMLAALGQKRVFTDSDIPYRLKDLAMVVERLDYAPVVVGDRTLAGSRYLEEVPTMRRLASKAFAGFASHVISPGLRDTQCGLKGFTAAAAIDIFSRLTFERFSFDVEVLHIAMKRKYHVDRVPVVLERNLGSSVHVFRDSIRMLRDLAHLKWNDAMKRYD